MRSEASRRPTPSLLVTTKMGVSEGVTTATTLSPAPQVTAPSAPTSTARSSSKGRRRSTISSLFSKSSPQDTSSTSVHPVDIPSARRPSLESTSLSSSNPSASTHLAGSRASTSPASKSKPPVSLPGMFRRRRSSDSQSGDVQARVASGRTSMDDQVPPRHSSDLGSSPRQRRLSDARTANSRIYQGAGVRGNSGGTTSTYSGRSPDTAITSESSSSRRASRSSLGSPEYTERAQDEGEEPDISSGSGEEGSSASGEL